MTQDIHSISDGWDFSPDEVRARFISALDGTTKVQLRLDLGILQMELDGRPDGTRPRGHRSLLDYFLAKERRCPGGVYNEKLDADACSELQQECTQYYYRILAFSALSEWDRLQEDTEHNLELIDFAAEYAEDDETAWQFSQLFPYLSMMNARAKAELEMAAGHFGRALEIAHEAEKEIAEFFKENYDAENEDGSPVPTPSELVSIRELAEQVEDRRPRSPDEDLREKLAKAIENENYELAAALRDQLKRIHSPLPSRPAPKKHPRPGPSAE